MEHLLFVVASYPVHALFLAVVGSHLARVALGELRERLLPARRRFLTASV